MTFPEALGGRGEEREGRRSLDPQENVLVIGGGIAGMTAAAALAELGHGVVLVEHEPRLGGRLAGGAALFPDLAPAVLVAGAEARLRASGAEVRRSTSLTSLSSDGPSRRAELSDGTVLDVASIVLATGLESIDPAVVPEYGHGRIGGVVTAAEMEELLSKDFSIEIAPRTVVFVQCVGSRSERKGVRYCGATCCATALKQALLVKRAVPSAEVYVLYIDLRTPGKGQEDLYRQARRAGVHFVRGMPSLVLQRQGGAVVCGEDTLQRQLYELGADLVVLAMGVRQSPANLALFDQLEVGQTTWGFPAADGTRTTADGVFVCGAAEAPKDAAAAMAQAEACALHVHRRLVKKEREKGLEGV